MTAFQLFMFVVGVTTTVYGVVKLSEREVQNIHSLGASASPRSDSADPFSLDTEEEHYDDELAGEKLAQVLKEHDSLGENDRLVCLRLFSLDWILTELDVSDDEED